MSDAEMFHEAMQKAAQAVPPIAVEPIDSQLAQARAKTVQCVVNLARTSLDREQAYKDKTTHASKVHDSAIAFRNAERELSEAIQNEVVIIKQRISEGRM